MAAILTNWTLAVGGPTCLPVEHRGQRVLFGNVTGRLGVKDGDPIRTNILAVFVPKDELAPMARTFSQSIYMLVGPACEDFAAWRVAQDEGFQRATEGYLPIGEAAITEVED